MKERVQKLMAQANIGSRRACEDIIRQGRVRVNGQVIHIGDQADPRSDIIEVDGEKLAFPDRQIYIAFNKPRNVLSTDEPHKDDTRKTVREYIPVEGHLFIVGRLDAESEGLVVLTNDGDLANRLAHPRYRHTKTYRAVVYGLPTPEAIAQWASGVHLEDHETGQSYKTTPCHVEIVKGGKESVLSIVMTEGKKRQIRRVGAALGYPIKSLTRTHIGKLALGTMRPGEWRELTPQDVSALRTSDPQLRRAVPPPPAASRPQRSPAPKPGRSPRPSKPRRTTRRRES